MSLSSRQQIVKQTIEQLAPQYKQMEADRYVESILPSLLLYPVSTLGLISKKSPLLEDIAKQDESKIAELVKTIDAKKEIPEGKFKIIFRILTQCLDEKQSITHIKKSIEENVYNNKTIKFEDSLKLPFSHMLQLLKLQTEISELKTQNTNAITKLATFDNQFKALEKVHLEAITEERDSKTAFQTSLENNKQKLDITTKKLEAAEQELQRIHSELKNYSTQNETDLLAKNKALTDTEHKLTQAIKNAEAINQQKIIITTKLEESINKIAKLNNSIEELRKKIEDDSRQNACLIKLLNENKFEIETLRKEIRELQNIKLDLSSRCKNQDREIRQLNDLAERDKKYSQDQHIKHEQLRELISTLKDEKAKLLAKINGIELNNTTEHAKLQKKIDDLLKSLKNAHSINHQQQIKLETQQENHAQLQDKYTALSLAYSELAKKAGEQDITMSPANSSNGPALSMFAKKAMPTTTHSIRRGPGSNSCSKHNS